MQNKDYTKEEFDKLDKLVLDEGIFHNESEKLLIDDNEVLKIFREKKSDSFGIKLYTLNGLNERKKSLKTNRIILPNSLISVNKEIIGYKMNYIKGKNLSTLLKDETVPFETKLDYLKQIGHIFLELKESIKNNALKDFALNDVHENNFVVDEQNRVFVVDIDSAYLEHTAPFGTRYLNSCSATKYAPNKYNTNLTRSFGGSIIPTHNTDLYCYTIIILNLLYGNNVVHRFSIDNYKAYIEYLKANGLCKELEDIFLNIYTENDNINPIYYLDNLSLVYENISSHNKKR